MTRIILACNLYRLAVYKGLFRLMDLSERFILQQPISEKITLAQGPPCLQDKTKRFHEVWQPLDQRRHSSPVLKLSSCQLVDSQSHAFLAAFPARYESVPRRSPAKTAFSLRDIQFGPRYYTRRLVRNWKRVKSSTRFQLLYHQSR